MPILIMTLMILIYTSTTFAQLSNNSFEELQNAANATMDELKLSPEEILDRPLFEFRPTRYSSEPQVSPEDAKVIRAVLVIASIKSQVQSERAKAIQVRLSTMAEEILHPKPRLDVPKGDKRSPQYRDNERTLQNRDEGDSLLIDCHRLANQVRLDQLRTQLLLAKEGAPAKSKDDKELRLPPEVVARHYPVTLEPQGGVLYLSELEYVLLRKLGRANEAWMWYAAADRNIQLSGIYRFALFKSQQVRVTGKVEISKAQTITVSEANTTPIPQDK